MLTIKIKSTLSVYLSMTFLFITSILTAQSLDTMRVYTVMGVDAYILSEPLKEYKVVLDGRNGIQWTSLFTAGLINESVNEKANQMAKGVTKTARKYGIEIDAVLYTGGKDIVGIKYTDENNLALKGLARPYKVNGVNVYVLGEPIKKYQVLETMRGGIKMKSMITAGLLNNSIEKDIEGYVKRIQKKTRKIGGVDAVIYSSGKSATGVKWL